MSQNYKIVIVGSNKFDDKSFVFGVLDQLQNLWELSNSKIDRLYSGSFSGVSQFGREWAELNSVEYKEHHFFSKENDNPLFESLKIPDFVIKNDEFYQKGKTFLMEEGINLLVLMPNKEGELGVHSENIKRMAESAGISILNAQDLYKQILATRERVRVSKETQMLNEEMTNKETKEVKKLSSLDMI